MAVAQVAEKHGDEWDLTWYLQWGIHTYIPTSTQSEDSLAPVETPNLKISSDGTFLIRSRRPSQSVWK